MEIDDNNDSTAEITDTIQTPQESNNIPELQIEITEESIFTASLVKRIRRRRALSPLDRRRALLYKPSMPVLSCNEQCLQSGEKTHISRFQKRQITPIQEEVFQFKKQIRNPFFDALNEDYKKKVEAYKRKKQSRNPVMGVKSKSKDYKQKVASLKLFIERLRMTNLTNPTTLQNNIPDETIQLFEKIHI